MRLLQTVFLILLSVGIFAQDTLHTENSVLWKISGNSLEQDSYLFGTIHMIPKKDFFFTPKMKEVFDVCEILALEIDINISLKKQFELAQKALLPNGKRLSDFMENSEYLRLRSYVLDTLGIKKSKWNQIERLKPIFSTSILINELIKKSKAYEKEFNKRANKRGLLVVGLETADFQIETLNKLTIEDQINMISSDEFFGDPLTEFNELVQMYKAQDLLSMLEMFYEDESMKEIEDELLIQRNKNWIPVISNYISKKPVFIAVGAMHLPGEYGLLNLLKQNGYSLTPLNIHE